MRIGWKAKTVTVVPAGVTPGFSAGTVTGAGRSTLTLTTTTAVANGTYPLTITGASGSVTHTAGVSLTVSAAATIQINSAGGAVGSWWRIRISVAGARRR